MLLGLLAALLNGSILAQENLVTALEIGLGRCLDGILDDLTEEQAEAITKAQLQDDEYMASYQRPVAAPGA